MKTPINRIILLPTNLNIEHPDYVRIIRNQMENKKNQKFICVFLGVFLMKKEKIK